MINLTKKVSIAIAAAMLVFSVPAFADVTLGSMSAQFSEFSLVKLLDPATVSPEVKSVLSVLFGDVIFDKGGTQSALGYGAGKLSWIAIVLAAIVLAYTSFSGALNTATSGVFLGKNYSSVWLPLRISAGFGLLLPGALKTYSVIQVLMFYIIILSSNFADALWVSTVKQVLDGDATIAAPGENMQPPDASQVISIAGSAFCANNLWRTVNGNDGTTSNEPLYSISYRTKGAAISTTKTYSGQPSDAAYSIPSGAVLTSITFGKNGQCGSLSIGTLSSRAYNDSVQAALANASGVVMDYLNYFSGLEVDAFKKKMFSKTYYLNMENHSGSDEDMTKFRKNTEDFSKEIKIVAAQYPKDLLEALSKGFKDTNKDDSVTDEKLKSKSWIMAGNYIIDIQKFSAGKFEALGYVNQGVVNNAWRTCIKGTIECAGAEKTIMDKLSDFFNSNEKDTTMAMMNVVQQALKAGSPMDDGCGAQDLACSAINFDKTLSNRLNSTIIDGLGSIGNLVANGGSTVGAIIDSGGSNGNAATSAPTVLDFAGHTSPFIMVQTLGLGLNAMATLAMATLGALYVAGHALGDSAISLAGGGGISAAVDFVSSTFRPIITLILVTGMSLAYLPLIMIVVKWLITVVEWMLMLVEAVIASTLAVVLMITPEGEGILGTRLQQSVTLVAQVLITPALNILSLFAVLGISMAGFGLLNMFWFSNVGFEAQGTLSGVFKLFMYVITLNAMLWTILEIPKVMKAAIVIWFGGSSSSGLQNNIGDKAEQTTKTVENAIGAGVGGAVAGLKRAKDVKGE